MTIDYEKHIDIDHTPPDYHKPWKLWTFEERQFYRECKMEVLEEIWMMLDRFAVRNFQNRRDQAACEVRSAADITRKMLDKIIRAKVDAEIAHIEHETELEFLRSVARDNPPSTRDVDMEAVTVIGTLETPPRDLYGISAPDDEVPPRSELQSVEPYEFPDFPEPLILS